MAEAFAFSSQDSIDRVIKATRWVEDKLVRPPSGSSLPLPTPYPVIVRVTGYSGEGKFTGVLTFKYPGTSIWADKEECVAFGLNGEQLTIGRRYLGQVQGTEGGKVLVGMQTFSLNLPGSGDGRGVDAFECVTDVELVGLVGCVFTLKVHYTLFEVTLEESGFFIEPVDTRQETKTHELPTQVLQIPTGGTVTRIGTTCDYTIDFEFTNVRVVVCEGGEGS